MQKKNNVHVFWQGSAQCQVSRPAQFVALYGIFCNLGADDNSSLRVRGDNILGRQGAEAHRTATLKYLTNLGRCKPGFFWKHLLAGELGAALAAPAQDCLLSARGGSALQKPVRAGAFAFFWLVCLGHR